MGRACRGGGRAASSRLRLSVSLERMASTTPRTRTKTDAASGRGPRRTPAVATDRHGKAPDLEAFRTLLHAAILEEHPGADLEPVDRAYDLAVSAHEGQKRASGDPYVIHPIASAQILAELGLDTTAIQAALLHDVPEDTEYSLTDVEEKFGPEVAQLVDGVTKLSRFSTHSHEQQQAENIRKMLLAMAQDIRVVLIKLADRLHNMRTLHGAAGREAAAHRAPDDGDLRATGRATRHLADEVGARGPRLQGARTRTLPRARASCSTRAARVARRTSSAPSPSSARASRRPASPPTSRAARSTSTASGRRCSARARSSARSTTSTPIRLLVDEVRDCYAALGIVHSIWRPIPGQFDDYIAGPKEQPLPVAPHRGHRARRQAARDPDPDPSDAPGRRGRASPRTGATRRAPSPTASTTPSSPGCASSWTGSATCRESDATEFVDGIKLDIFQDQVFVFTPKGDIKDLPAGATPLDFAYRIHTDVGHRTIGAKVNNRLVPLDYRLKNGDIVEIVTTKGEHGPSRDWLNVVRTQPRPREDPPMVQAQGPRREHRPRPRVARARAPPPGADVDRGGRPGPDRRRREAVQLRHRRRLLRGHRLRRDRRPDGRHEARRRRRRPEHAPDRRAATAHRADRRRPGQGRRRPARPLRQVLPPDPGRPDRRVHHPRQGRDRPPPDVQHGRQRARGQPAHRGRMGVGADRDLSDRHPRRGLRPDRASCPTSPRSWPRTRSTSSPRTSA